MRNGSRISAMYIRGIAIKLADKTSNNTTPNEKTSDFSVSWRDRRYYGSRYPTVPDTSESEFNLIKAFDKEGGPIFDSRNMFDPCVKVVYCARHSNADIQPLRAPPICNHMINEKKNKIGVPKSIFRLFICKCISSTYQNL
ncbi:unnamed protein product [Malus baccata var. baccata]